jgi:hypothetical protein
MASTDIPRIPNGSEPESCLWTSWATAKSCCAAAGGRNRQPTAPKRCCAGPIAEEVLTGVGFEEQRGSYRDIEMSREALAMVDLEPRLDIDAVLPFTRLLVDHEWAAIQLLANQLIVQRELDYAQVLRLVQMAA